MTTLLGIPLDGSASSGCERCQKDAKFSYVSCSRSCVSISEGVASGSDTSGSIPPPSLTVRCLTSVVKLRRCTASPYFLFVFDQIFKTAPLHCLLLPSLFFVLLHQTGKLRPCTASPVLSPCPQCLFRVRFTKAKIHLCLLSCNFTKDLILFSSDQTSACLKYRVCFRKVS